MKSSIFIVSLFLASVVLVGCGQRAKQAAKNSAQALEQTGSESGLPNESVVSDGALIEQLPDYSQSGTDVDIVLPAGYRGTHPADFEPMLTQDWYDFYRDTITNTYRLERAEIEIGNYYDGCLGDSTTYVDSRRNSLILIRGLAPHERTIPTVTPKKRYIWPEEKGEFTLNGKSYTLRGEGITKNIGKTLTDWGEDQWNDVRNYKLYLSDGANEQLIIAIPSFNQTFAEILWIGDLDADGKPDLLLDTSRDYEEKAVILFLSSKATGNEFMKAAASSMYQFDC